MYIHEEKLNFKIGLVLSGGGAKGAYQAGVFRALGQLGVTPMVKAVSGCSIGALNALLFAMDDPVLWEKAWQSASYQRFFARDEDTVKAGMGSVFQELLASASRAGLPELLTQKEFALFPQDSLAGYVREFVDPQKLAAAAPQLFICAYNLEQNAPEYFSLRGRPFADALTLTLASSAIPVVFPPVAFGGSHYCDGGIVPPYSALDNGDKVPLAPLGGLGLDVVIVSYLTHYDKVNPALLGGHGRLLELYPSRPLELVPGAGTMDLSKDSLRSHMELGWQDTMAAFAPFLAGILQNRPLETLLAEHNARNQLLLNREQGANQEVRQAAMAVRRRLAAFREKLKKD